MISPDQIPLLGIVQAIADAIGDVIKGLVEWVVGFVINLIASALLDLVLAILGPMVLYTPAVVDDPSFVVSNGFVSVDPVITDEIHEFYQRSLAIAAGLVGLSVAISAVMLMLGFIPSLKDAAKDNFSRLILLAPAAFVAPYILQMIINVNGLLNLIPCPQGPTDCLSIETAAYFSIGSGNPLADGIGKLITAVALLFSIVYFAARYAVIILVAAISPLMFVGMAFNFSRPMATKLFSTFNSAVFYQFFGLTILKIGLDLASKL
jgi:hypothetical protein